MIKVKSKTKNKASLKMFNELISYIFEQQFDELKDCSLKEKATLEQAAAILKKIVILGE